MKEFLLQTNASDVGVGDVLSQLDEEGADPPSGLLQTEITHQRAEILRERVSGHQIWSHRPLECISWEDPS